MATDEAIKKEQYTFLQGGGEMGELMRTYDWSQTPLGHPHQWPQSLRTTVGIILNSRFPMFLFWGPELICFYNDAYRPSLGNDGKHPSALGASGAAIWPETWAFIKPLIDQVMAGGGGTWNEDQLLPIYRNGRLEDVYWTFSYSPVTGEQETVDGVLVVCTETTKQVNARKTIQENEERFRTMSEDSEILIAVSDETSNAVYFNNAWASLTGRDVDQLLKFGWADLIHVDDRDRIVSMYLDASKRQVPWSGEFRMLDKNGEYRWLLAKGPVRHHTDGSFAGYISSSIDITEQKQAELILRDSVAKDAEARKQLEKSAQQVRSLVESAPFPIGVYIGKEMRIQLVNQSILDTWGKGNDVVGKLYSDILPEVSNDIYNQLDEVYTTGKAFHARNQRVDLQIGDKLKPFYFNYSFTPLHDEDGKIYGVMNTAADVTDLNLAKQKIEENEKSFRNTILKAPVAMCIFRGPKHVVEVANDRMIELWGTELSKVINKPIFEGLPEAGKQGFEQLLDNVYNTGETFAAQGVPIGLNRGGRISPVYVNFVYEAYKEAGGEVSGVLAVATDVTEQVLARQKIEEIVGERTKELAQANTNLQKSNAELAQFAYIASHDLQEPLRKVSTFTEMLKSNLGEVDDRSKNYLDKITSASGRMLALIRDVLTYSQLSGEGNIFSPVDLRDVIENVKTDFELLIDQKGAIIRYAPLPVIEAIPLQMSQLFGNLISNALKFTRPHVPPTIDITVATLTKEAVIEWQLPNLDGIYFNIEIRDNGIGFNKEYAGQIFNIFQRLHGKQSYAGTGIGLAICKKIAQNHYGDIDASQSSEEHGAVFNVILPLRQGK